MVYDEPLEVGVVDEVDFAVLVVERDDEVVLEVGEDQLENIAAKPEQICIIVLDDLDEIDCIDIEVDEVDDENALMFPRI